MPTFDEMVGAAFDKATAPPMKGEKKPKVEVEMEAESEDDATGETPSLSAAEQKILDAVKSGSDALKAAVKAAC